MFLSYQWGKQPQVKALYQRLTAHGYTVWMDIYQMGGGDSLYDKIDRGMRGCKAVVSCVTQKYSLSANCRREVSLADALKKPIIPLLLEDIKWPPDGPMSMVFTQLLYINFHRDEAVQMTWEGDQYEELRMKLGEIIPATKIGVKNAIADANGDNSAKSSAPKNDQAKTTKVTLQEKSTNSTSVQRSTRSVTGDTKVASPTKSAARQNDHATTKKIIPKERPTSSTTSRGSASVIVEQSVDLLKAQAPNTNQASKKVTPKEKTTTIQESAASATVKQKQESSANGQNSDKTPTVQKSTVNKAVAVRAFGGSIAKDKIAQDIAAGNKSTIPRSGFTKSANLTNGSEDKTSKPGPTPGRAVNSMSGKTSSSSLDGYRSASIDNEKGTLDGNSDSKVTSEKSQTRERVRGGRNEVEKISTAGRQMNTSTNINRSQNNSGEANLQTNRATSVNQRHDNSTQVNGGGNEPKSKSCIIL